MTPARRKIFTAERDRLVTEIARMQGLVDSFNALLDEVPAIQAAAPAPIQPRPAPAPPAPVQPTPPPPAPAPAPEPKKIYPPVATLRKPAAAPPRAAHVPGSTSATQQAFGADGNGGRGHTDTGRIKVSTYLIRKGHSVSPAAGGSWRVDGKVMDKLDVLDLINEHRAKAEVPPAVLQDLE